MTAENITIKALNPDNDGEVLQVVRLFERTYAKSFPITTAYDKKFWKAHAGSRFFSLIAVDGIKVIAHVAVRPDRDNPSHVQIYLPVCDPNYLALQETLHNEFVSFIERRSLKQGWNMLYYHVVGGLPEMQFFASEVFNTKEVAIWPGCLPAPEGATEQSRRHVLVTQKMIQLESQSASASHDVLYVPEWHNQICKSLYSSLGLNPVFSDKNTSKSCASKAQTAVAADKRAIDSRSYRRTGVTLSHIEPSLLRNIKSSVEHLSAQDSQWQYLSINLRDSNTPQFCQALEEADYKFCGILPFHRSKHSILYSNQVWTKDDAAQLSNSSSVLSRYMLGVDNVASLSKQMASTTALSR